MGVIVVKRPKKRLLSPLAVGERETKKARLRKSQPQTEEIKYRLAINGWTAETAYIELGLSWPQKYHLRVNGDKVPDPHELVIFARMLKTSIQETYRLFGIASKTDFKPVVPLIGTVNAQSAVTLFERSDRITIFGPTDMSSELYALRIEASQLRPWDQAVVYYERAPPLKFTSSLGRLASIKTERGQEFLGWARSGKNKNYSLNLLDGRVLENQPVARLRPIIWAQFIDILEN